jgi:hypothetical protein
MRYRLEVHGESDLFNEAKRAGKTTSDGEPQYWRVLSRATISLVVLASVKAIVVDDMVWDRLAGFCFMGITVGKWMTPHIRRLDTDRFPDWRELECAIWSMSNAVAWASVVQA